MDLNDFLIEYDLTEEDKKLAARLKAQAHQRQLLNALADHALFYGRQAVARRRRAQSANVKSVEAVSKPARRSLQGTQGSSSSARVSTGASFVNGAHRSAVLDWFSSLSVAERVSVLTCDDASWVRAATRMSRQRGPLDSLEGHFSISARPSPAQAKVCGLEPKAPARPALRGRGGERASRAAAAMPAQSNAATWEPVVHYRRPYRQPDGDMIVRPATPEFEKACRALLTGIRVAFKGCCCASLAFEWAAVLCSPELVRDVETFTRLMDEVSLGRFLHESLTEEAQEGRDTTMWTQAPWLLQWGKHFPLAAFIGSRLEVLLSNGFRARDTQMQMTLSLPLAEVWTTIPANERAAHLNRLVNNLFRRLISETLALGLGNAHEPWHPHQELANLLFEKSTQVDHGTNIATFVQQSSLEFVGAVTTVPLVIAAKPPEGTMKDMLINCPQIWLHQQFAEELAIACSEHSACALLSNDAGSVVNAAARNSKRREKKQRQKQRRKQASEAMDSAHLDKEIAEDSAEQQKPMRTHPEEQQQELSGIVNEIVEAAIDENSSYDTLVPEALKEHAERYAASTITSRADVATQHGPEPVSQDPVGRPRTFLPLGRDIMANRVTMADRYLDDWDDHASEMSSIGLTATSRSNSISEGIGIAPSYYPVERRWGVDMLTSRRRIWRDGHKHRWHDDSRLEFLLRSRDRRLTEADWDHMSVGSVPASLDEAVLCPVGLETRFAYLFDSPPRSQLTSRIPSQSTADDDHEREMAMDVQREMAMDVQWDGLEEWRSLTEALEKTEGELSQWKAKAQELEAQLAHSQPCGVSGGSKDCASGVPGGSEDVVQATANSPLVVTSPLPSVHSDGGSPCSHSTQLTPNAGMPGRIRRSLSSEIRGDAAPGDFAWRYLVLLVLARRQLELQRDWQRMLLLDGPEKPQKLEEETGPSVARAVERSYSLPGVRVSPVDEIALPSEEDANIASSVLVEPIAEPATSEPCDTERRASEPECSGTADPDWMLAAQPVRATGARKRALQVAFDTKRKRNLCDSATQTAPAITLSKMYGGMIPRYIQRELARFRQENQILRYRVASLAMSQPLGRPKPVRDAATQTAPAITFSTARQQGGVPGMPRDIAIMRQGQPDLRVPVRGTSSSSSWISESGNQQLKQPDLRVREPSDSWVLEESARAQLDKSILEFTRAVQAQAHRQEVYRCVVQDFCKRTVQTLWPRCSVELYGSFASGLALPSSGCDLVIQESQDASLPDCRLSPIDEDVDQLRPLPLDEVSPGHPGAVPSLASGWQQQLSCRLAQEKWVLSDSIRVTALAAIPVLSFITAPDDATLAQSGVEMSLVCPIRVDISLEVPNHRGLWSKAIIDVLLGEYPMARPVTLVLKQWLIERTSGTSHTGGLCSYGLLLMVIGFLQHYPTESAAVALVGFLSFYGRRFDPQLYGVSVARGAFLHRKSPATWPAVRPEYIERGFCPGSMEFAALPRKLSMTGDEAHRFDPLWIEDPLNPTNNVGRNCFRIGQIQRSLARAADALTASEASYQLRAILTVESSGPEHGEEGEPHNPHSQARWHESLQSLHERHARYADLYSQNLYSQSLVEHPPNLMMPLPKHAQILRSHLPQQWDSAVRYGARPNVRRGC